MTGVVSLRYQNLTAEWIEGAAHCERVAFPTADPGDLLGAEDFAAYLDVFPDDVFVVIDDDAPTGRAHDARHDTDDLLARIEALEQRVAALESAMPASSSEA